MTNQINAKVMVTKVSRYNEDSMWGAYGLKLIESDKQMNTYGNGGFNASGVSPELMVGTEYELVLTHDNNPKFPMSHSIVAVKPRPMNTPEDQQAYIRAMLKEKQAEAIISKYPNHLILDMMKDDTFDYSDIKGIKEKTYQKIKDYLFKNMDIQEAIVDLKELKISFKSMKKLIDHFGSAQLVVQCVKANIYELCNVKDFGFKKVDEYAMNRGDDKDSRGRIYACMIYILEEEANIGHAWISPSSLVNKMSDLLQIETKPISDVLAEEEAKDGSDIIVIGSRVSLKKHFYSELNIMKKLTYMRDKECNTVINNIDDKIKEMEERNGFEFTSEQREAITMASENNIMILTGKGGTGKSFTIAGILEALSGYKYHCCAFSGKAANILARKGLSASTIHRMLQYDPSTGGFRYNRTNRLPIQVLVIDEASMIDSGLFKSIIDAMPDDSKIIICGDDAQLLPISVGSVFEDLLKSEEFPKQELTIVQRQAAKSGILTLANKVREGEQITKSKDEIKVHGELNDMVVVPLVSREHIQEVVLEYAKKFIKKDIMEFQVIVPMRSRGDISVKQLNHKLQDIFNGEGKSVNKNGYNYRVGSKIIQNGNNYDAYDINDEPREIFNGTLGMIKNIEFDDERNNHTFYIKFEDVDELVVYKVQQMDQVELAYAITTHKSQGSTIPYVLYAVDYASYNLLTRSQIYTGISRSSKGCVVVAENKALHHAIRTDDKGSRRTYLYDLLVGHIEFEFKPYEPAR